MYADYGYYVTEWYGTAIQEADFPRLGSRASDFIDYYTRNKASKVPETDTDTIGALAKCCCALAEVIQTDERNKALAAQAATNALTSGTGELKSESVGSYSVSYATAADYSSGRSATEAAKDIRGAYAAICAQYLAHTGLLYRG